MIMTTSPATEPADVDKFHRDGVAADAVSVAHIRDDLSRWLRIRFELDPTRLSDVVLAVNEALANSAEFAYLTAAKAGHLSVYAERDPVSRALWVTVADEGVWRETDPGEQRRTRGRGIPLMHALADEAIIDRSESGTTVRLRFENVTASSGAYL